VSCEVDEAAKAMVFGGQTLEELWGETWLEDEFWMKYLLDFLILSYPINVRR